MAHTRWVNSKKWTRQAGPELDLRLDDGRIAERESVDQTGLGIEAADVPITNVSTVDHHIQRTLGSWTEHYSFKSNALRFISKLLAS